MRTAVFYRKEEQNRMGDRLRKYLIGIIGFFTVLFPFFFYSSDLRARQDLNFLEKVVLTFNAPVDAVFRFFRVTVAGVVDDYILTVGANEEARQLREENAKLSVQLQIAREMELENERLRALLQFREEHGREFMASRVLARDPTYFYDSVRLNRGARDGVRPGMSVMAAAGAVGLVIKVTADTAHVLLVTDPNSSVDVIVARNRKRGVLEGTAGSSMRLKHVGKGGNVQVGDLLLTSGLTGSFPRGILVGRVSNIQLESDHVTQKVEVEPSVPFEDLSEVLVLKAPSLEMEVLDRVGGPDWMERILRTGQKGGS
jgi:rod shape-determining protein MreC